MSDQRHILRGGIEEVILYTDAGDVHSVGSRVRGESELPTEDVEYYVTGTGVRRPRRRQWTWEPVLVDEADLQVLRVWQEAGKKIGVIGLGPQVLLWRELVPVLLEDAGGARGQFGGKRLVLHTRLFEAEVARSADLLAGVDGTEDAEAGTTAWRAALPLVRRLVLLEAQKAGDVTVRLYDAAGEVLTDMTTVAETRQGIYVELLDGTHGIEVETNGTGDASARPRLTLDRDSFALTLAAIPGGTQELRTFGRGSFEAAGTGTLSAFGASYDVYDYYDLLPTLIGAQRIEKTPDTVIITHDA